MKYQVGNKYLNNLICALISDPLRRWLQKQHTLLHTNKSNSWSFRQLFFNMGFNYENARKLIHFLKTQRAKDNFELQMLFSQHKVFAYGLLLQPPLHLFFLPHAYPLLNKKIEKSILSMLLFARVSHRIVLNNKNLFHEL